MREDPAGLTDGYLLDVLRAGPSGVIDQVLRADTLTYLPEDLLVKVDRASMANSLEARAPLLDHRLIEFVAALPSRRKLRYGTTKVLLREIAHELLPARLVNRPKLGFSVPIGEWFAKDLGSLYEEMVLAPDAQLRNHLDQGVAASLLHQHRLGQGRNAHRLWLLLMFEAWARRWLAGDGRPAG
jgi:asparagine synthase (glutamine-hydrolysing)